MRLNRLLGIAIAVLLLASVTEALGQSGRSPRPARLAAAPRLTVPRPAPTTTTEAPTTTSTVTLAPTPPPTAAPTPVLTADPLVQPVS